MTDHPQPPMRDQARDAGLRAVLGFVVGIGAVGIMLVYGRLGRELAIDSPIDLSGPLLVVPIIVIAWLAGAALGDRVGVVAVTAGMTVGPLLAVALMDGDCSVAGFVAIGMTMFALVGLILGGAAAAAGARWGGGATVRRRRPALRWVVGVIAVAGLVAFASVVPSLACG